MPLLKTQSWPEVQDYLKTSQSIILPIGSFEQHGPTGLIGTDTICPEVIAEEIGEQTGLMIGPTISVGSAQHHLGFTGTITLRPSTLMLVIQDMVNSLALHGFNKIMLYNGHGGNINPVNTAFAEIYAETSFNVADPNRPALELYLVNWFTGPKMQAYCAEHFGDKDGDHATPSEISVTNFAYPDAVKNVVCDPEIANHGEFIRDSKDYRQQFPDGRIASQPSLASIEHGENLVRVSVEDCIGRLKDLGMV